MLWEHLRIPSSLSDPVFVLRRPLEYWKAGSFGKTSFRVVSGGGKLEGPKVEVREIDFLITVYDPVAKEKTFEVLYIFEEKLKATEMK